MAKGEKGRVRRKAPASKLPDSNSVTKIQGGVRRTKKSAEPSLKAAKNEKPAQTASIDKAIVDDVATFAAKLGFSVGGNVAISGFDDSDFRKKGSVVKPKKLQNEAKKGAEVPMKPEKTRIEKNKKKEFVKGTQNWNAAQATQNKEIAKSDIERPYNLKATRITWKRVSLNDDELGQSWYSAVDKLFADVAGEGDRTSKEPLDDNLIEAKRLEGEKLLLLAAETYNNDRSRDSDAKWLFTARRSGTMADKVAAMTVVIEEDPVANLDTLDALIALLSPKGGKRNLSSAMDALRELFTRCLLPDRKLKPLSDQPLHLLPAKETKGPARTLLLLWAFEHKLKERYTSFVSLVEQASRDPLLFVRERCLGTLETLLSSKPEQERTLLRSLVNKLGDPERKVASTAGYRLGTLLTEHPNMKRVVVTEVGQFVFRPGLGLRAQYYAAVFLSQVIMSDKGDGPMVARHIIEVYFGLFRSIVEKEDGLDLVSAPSEASKSRLQKKKRQAKRRNSGRKAALHKKAAAAADPNVQLRLLSVLITGVNRAFPFVAKSDAADLVQAHSASLFRLVHSEHFSLAVQSLCLLQNLLTAQDAVSDRFFRALYSMVLASPAVAATSPKVALFLNTVLRAVRSDADKGRVSALVKRMLQVALHSSAAMACAVLILVSEIIRDRPELWRHILEGEESGNDELEHFEDQSSDHEAEVGTKEEQEPGTVSEGRDLTGKYNWRHRDPKFCGALDSCWWELSLLRHHAHPSVTAMAGSLLAGTLPAFQGDPLRDFSLGTFLDKMASKSGAKGKKGGAQADGEGPGAVFRRGRGIVPKLPFEVTQLAEMVPGDIPVEDAFFHKFYLSQAENKFKSRGKKKKKKEIEEEDEWGHEDRAEEWGDDAEDEVDALLDEDRDSDAGQELSEEDGDSVGDGEVSAEDDDQEDGLVDEDSDFGGDSDGGEVEFMDFSDGEEEEEVEEDVGPAEVKGKGKRQRGKMGGSGPFADASEYEDLIKGDSGGSAGARFQKRRKGEGEKKRK